MGGRVKRVKALAEAEARAARPAAAASACTLCHRPLGARTELHHVVPKSRGGTETVAVHPICHRAIHACVTNRELATTFVHLDALRAREDVARFLRWVADKPPDFNAPTRRPSVR